MSEKLSNRLGEIGYNNCGSKMIIVEYNSAKDIWVEFQDEYKIKTHTRYKDFKNGKVGNPYDKTMYGVGCLGVGEYKGSIGNSIPSHCYQTWTNMLMRCYSKKYQSKNDSYKGCLVENSLLNFQNFAKWYDANYYEIEEERMCLDKDILCKGNRVYSPDTIIFVPQRINILFCKNDKIRGKYPIGVSYSKSRKAFRSECKVIKGGERSRVLLGCFKTELEAFEVYKNFKENYIKQVADEYKELIPKKLYDALYKYQVEITD